MTSGGVPQPLAYDDIIDHAELQPQLKTAICLDESILGVDDARKALKLGACRIVNVKLGRVSGHTEARRIQAYCHERNVPVWCGGMLETGIGRAANAALAALDGFTLPGDISASRRFYARDIVTEPIDVVDGHVAVPSGVGFGFELDRAFLDEVTTARIEL